MYRILIFLFLFASLNSFGQVSPEEGSALCYRLIGFSFPVQTGTVKYTLEVARGNYNNEIAFGKNICASAVTNKNRTLAEVPSFGSSYTWRTVAYSGAGVKTSSALHHFSVKITPDVDTNITRLRIINKAEKNKDAYIFVDNARAIYDMKGKPIWFLPGTELEASRNALPRDMKATPQGTITFLTGGRPYEITYDGNIVWSYRGSADRNRTDTFHHEFTRLQNGHRMGMLMETAYRRLPAYKDSIAIPAWDSARFCGRVSYNVIEEYDQNNKVVWRWDGYKYILQSDLAKQKNNDLFDINDLHENALFFDEKNKAVYLSFKNISRIIKIKYPEGNVLNTYGTAYRPGISNMGNDIFCTPHCCRHSDDYMYFFNNNTCSKVHLPIIMMMQEPAPLKTELKTIWEYECTVEGPDRESIASNKFNSSGYVQELPDKSMLVMMGAPYPKMFIVDHDKRIQWSAMPERYDTQEKKWKMFTELYRVSMISRKQMEQLIWNSRK